MGQDRLFDGALLFPGMATPRHDPPPGGYRIQRAIDAGGFGITYEAIKRDGGDPASDVTANLWLPPYKAIVIKEFFPDFATRVGRTITVDDEEEGHGETFERALQRFQREAERLCYLTCLRALRAARGAFVGSSGVLGQRIDAEIEAAWLGNSDPGRAMQLVGRLTGEARDAAQKALATSTLPIVYDFFASDDNAYYVMEFIGGGTLKARLNEDRRNSGTNRVEIAGMSYQLRRPWDVARLRRFASAALDALDELHTGIPGQQLIHCDLKPGNIMFRSAESDDPVLIDFGLARNVNDGKSRSLVAGTTGFAPLEIDPHTRSQYDDDRFGGANVGPWTDIYALAAILRMLATGVEGSRLPAVFERIRMAPGDVDPVDRLPPFPEGFPEAMARGIRRGMALHMRDRPQSVAEWRRELGLDDNVPSAAPAGGDSGGSWGVRRTWSNDETMMAPSQSSTSRPPLPLAGDPAEEAASAPTRAASGSFGAAPARDAVESTRLFIGGSTDIGRADDQALPLYDTDPYPPATSRGGMPRMLIVAIVGVALILMVGAGLFFGGVFDGNETAPVADATPAADDEDVLKVDGAIDTMDNAADSMTTDEPDTVAAQPEAPSPATTVARDPAPAPKPSTVAVPDLGAGYQYTTIGVSTRALEEAEIDQLLLSGIKVNGGVAVTRSVGLVAGLVRGTLLASSCDGGSARNALRKLDGGVRTCFRTGTGNRWFDAP